MSLEDFLKFEQIATPLLGETAFTPTSRPTKSGVKLLAVPSNCVGLAFRVCHSTLEALNVSSDTGAKVIFSTALEIPAVNIAASPDGRLMAVCLANGSLCCFDVVNGSFQLRWKVEGAHSHTQVDLNQSVSKSRENAAGAAGPARSLQFSPMGYALALVDDGQQGLTIYHADDCGTPVESVQRQLADLNLACAAWSPSFDAATNECTIALGTIDGNGIHVFKYNLLTSKLSPTGVLPFPGESDGGPLWSCTHIEWIPDGNSLGCGYCRVLPPEDDVEEDEDDQDDAAQHEVCFYVASFPADENPPQNMGDVVPFFAPSKDGRHVFFTTPVINNSKCNIMLVGSNVGSEIHVLAGELPSSWVEVDLPEGDNICTPTDDDYDFTYPTGLSVAHAEKEGMRLPLVLLLSTDGSLSCFHLLHEANESFFQLPLQSGVTFLHASPLPKSSRSNSASELIAEDTGASLPVSELPVSDVKLNLFGQDSRASFGFDSLAVSSPSPLKSAFESSGTTSQPSVFEGSAFGQVANTNATNTSTSSLSFGSSIISPQQPVFGQTSSLLGPQSAPIGSGSDLAFGSGKATLSFGSGDTKNVFGSGALSSKPFSFEALASSPAAFGQSADPFNTFNKPSSSAFALSDITKPLFGTSTDEIKKEENPIQSTAPTEAPPRTDETVTENPEIGQDSKLDPSESTPEAKKAAEAFDEIDSAKQSVLALDRMEDLIEALGEGFYGDELAKQVKLVDKDGKGHIDRQAFIDWYVQLLSGDDDGASSGGSEESDQQEERERATAKFQELCTDRGGVRSISESDFPQLFESLGTTYCEEEHRKTIRKLKNADGDITEDAFVSWYIDWLFGGDESDIDDSEDEADDVEKVPGSIQMAATGWGNMFKAEEGSWKCEVCMVSNPGEESKCKACETRRPGTEEATATESRGGGAQIGTASAIGSSGFSFGGGVIGTSGFSFASGSTSPAPAPGTSSGFSFKPSGSSDSPSASGFHSAPDNSAKISGSSSDDILPKSKVERHSKLDPSESTPEAKKAAEAFDEIDSAKQSVLALDRMEDLIEALGEGFYGDELAKQVKLVDKDGKGHIDRQAFIDWYVQLLSGDDDGASSGGSEESDQQEERERATAKFQELCTDRGGVRSISESDFPQLFESLGTTYCEEEHRKTIRKLKNADGDITEDAFVSWYIDWLFGGDESDIDDSEDEADDVEKVPGSIQMAATGWGNMFKAEEGSWKCEVCMVSNPGEESKCKACETRRPGTEEATATESRGGGALIGSASAIGSSGFSFGGGVIGTSGFSFASGSTSPSPAPAPGTSSGFSFKPSGSSENEAANAPSLSSSSAFPPMSSKAATSEATKTPSTSSAFPPMSSTAPTPFSATTEAEKSASTLSAFPPMSSKAPTPFSATSEATKTPSTSSAFPPMSSTAPTPFSATTEAEKSASTLSAFPPMSSKAPTPFSATSEATKTPSTSSAFPPMSSTAPTPFSATTEAEKSASTLSAFPPMSSKAPTPFSATSEATKTPSTSSAFPPMSSTAPTPFSATTEAEKSASTLSAFPPMSSKAPTPFSATSEATKTPSTSSAFPPMSSTAPTPFSATTEAEKSASTLSAFPPMSSKAPTPFSATSEATKTPSTSSAFPPMSSTAPTPFSATTEAEKSASTLSAFPPMSSKAPTPFSATSEATKTPSTSSAFPPMSSTAPTPFSATTEAEKSASTLSAFPPMSSKAPTPFSATSEATKTPSTSSAFPPMSSTAPTPFSATTEATKSASTLSAFPPMSSKAPTPFSAGSAFGSTATESKTSFSSAFPPMSSKAPTPFSAGSAFGSTATESKTALSSSAFPPMSNKAPTPFSAGTAFGSTATESKTTSTSSAFPPMSSKAPTPFSATSEVTETALSSSTPAPYSGTPQLRKTAERIQELSEVANQYAATVQKMQERMDLLTQMRPKNSDAELKAEISNLARNIQESLVSFSVIQNSLSQQKQRRVQLLSHKATASMRVNECEKYLSTLLSSETEPSSLLKLQPLDLESESRRREITSAAMTLSRSIEILKSRSKLLDEIQETDGDMRLLVTINETRKNIQGLEEDVTRVEYRLSNAVERYPGIRSTSQSNRLTGGRSTQPEKRNNKNEVNWKEIESQLSALSELPRRTQLDLSLGSHPQVGQTPSVDDRKQSHSSTVKQPYKHHTLFSPALDLQPRAGWDEPSTLDQTKMKSLSYSAPSQLKSVAIDSAARSALSGFGTTPERVRESFTVSKPAESANTMLSSKATSRVPSSVPPQVERSAISQSPSRSQDLKPPNFTAPPSNTQSLKSVPKSSSPQRPTSLSKDVPTDVSEEKVSGLGILQGLGTMSFSNSLIAKTMEPPKFDMQPSGSDECVDFHKVLTEFYAEHNAAKLSEVPTVLSKYKGRESEMFAKLAKRYGVQNPLDHLKHNEVFKTADKSGGLFGAEPTSKPVVPIPSQQKPPLSQSPFGNANTTTSTSPFGAPSLPSSSMRDSQPSFGGFGSTPSSNFGLSTSSSLPFGGSTGLAASPSPFSAPPSMTPFGSASTTQPSSAPTFNGKSARELLIGFYQSHNPAKVDEADRLLEKYRGNEEALFRNLAKKYNLDPAMFGLTSAPAPAPGGFGSPSPLGGGSNAFGGAPSTPFGSAGFGSASPLGQSGGVFGGSASTPPTGSVFGAAAGSTSFGASGFGSLAQSPPGQGFGSFGSPSPPATFGASSPFGAPRR